MAELLAAGMTGGVNSLDVKPLKAPEGPPHDLGQFYLLVDPGCTDTFGARFAALAEAVAAEEGGRLPGQGKRHADPVALDETLWAQVGELAAPKP